MPRRYLWPGPSWSLALAIAAVSRAASYSIRPPAEDTPSSQIEAVTPYDVWAWLLIVIAALLVTGTLIHRLRWASWVGHVVGIAVYAAFAVSLTQAAIMQAQPWSGIAPLGVIIALHIGRLQRLGLEVRRG